ncbi:hypothetical protein D6D21_02252 [Aureobasidium pullulans]|uniref:Uncharacterized protein n=1 Tax=Aureobasidium pullulans TaxID=5580 RepID=A0AB74J5Y4_AURPU|nr:hypothetical protein D6D21_02252 [Aureobasidium pullulans]
MSTTLMVTHDHVQLKTCQIIVSNETCQDVACRIHASTIMLEADDRGTLFAILYAGSLRLSSSGSHHPPSVQYEAVDD